MATVARRSALEGFLKQRVGQDIYQLWFAGHTTFRARKDTLEVGVPNLHFQEWLSKKYTRDIASAAKEVLGRAVAVKFRIDPELFRSHRNAQEEAKLHPVAKAKRHASIVELPPPPARIKNKHRDKHKSATPSMFPEQEGPPRAAGKSPLSRLGSRRWFELKDFVAGPSNRVAHAAALSVVEKPGEDGNPLVLHGSVGTGKTHLLEGIYAGLSRRSPSLVFRYATAEDFTHRFIQSMRSGKLTSFRRQFRDCDALLLDNLHFLAKKKATQEEFLHTFDRLAHRGAQVVVTMDCHPRLAENLVPELVDRLLGGTAAALQPPDAKTRLDILRAKAVGSPVVPDAVLQDLAAKLRGNVRELEGAIRNLRHYAKVEGKPINLSLAQEALGDLLRHAVRIVGISDVDESVCQSLRLKPGTLQSHARSWSVSHPRMIAIYLSRKYTSASYSEIGKHFGGRNHSTAVAAENKVRQWIDDDANLIGGPKPCRVIEIIERSERALGV